MLKTLKIKPLSINDNCPIKKRSYFKEIERQLPNSIKLPKGRLAINYDIYLSQQNADLGNCEKLTTDAICKAWNIQDSNFYRIVLNRHDCEKGKERITFNIKGHKVEKIKPYIELIKFAIYTTIGVYLGNYIEIIRSLNIPG